MTDKIRAIIEKATGATKIYNMGVIQNLWSGYGKIVRYGLEGTDINSVVVKHVHLPEQKKHPRGWNTDHSHQRKLKSYEVETAWYMTWSSKCSTLSRIPKCFAVEYADDDVVMVLEDLDAAGYPKRLHSVTREQIDTCLIWLANFHATFMAEQPTGLWQIGTYWHLETRPDELRDMDDLTLKLAAQAIDNRLNSCTFQTFVHGDAKLANFCFSTDGSRVSAVDFQYVGGGCGMKDVAYFIGSCLGEEDCERLETPLLECYFEALRKALTNSDKQIDFQALESEWRSLFPVAWTDFHRFLKGWSPGHWKINSYSERVSREVVASINKEN